MPSELEFLSVSNADLEQVSKFLKSIFRASPDWKPFSTIVLQWKALDEHPLWQGSRGYVVREEEQIVAHGCLMPCRLLSSERTLRGGIIIDWAANKQAPGSGFMLYQNIGKLVDFLFGVGGSEEAKRVLPRMGFRGSQEFSTYTKILKPFAAFANTSQKTWKTPLRLAQNLWKNATSNKISLENWTTIPQPSFDDRVDAFLPKFGAAETFVCERNRALLNYFLSYPGAAMEGYLLAHKKEVVGYAVLARFPGECRIAELWITSDSVEEWAQAYTLISHVAAQKPDTHQVQTGCSNSISREALERAGFRLTGRQPIYMKISGPPGLKIPEFAMSMLDTDAFFL